MYIIRHGKSSWELEFAEDIDRPLTERGIRDAYEMGKRLIKRQLIPEVIFSSHANRALHTAVIMAGAMQISDDNVFIRRNLYMPSEEEIENTILSASDHIKKLAIFGHNPSFTAYANKYLKDPLDNIPTAGVVVITFDIDQWKAVSPGKVINEFVDCPKKKW